MDLICYYTPSHEKLFFNFFCQTLGVERKINLVPLKGKQLCKSATYYEEGWFDTVAEKIESIKNYIKKYENGEVFVFSDPDVIFLQPFYDRLLELFNPNLDMLLQNDTEGGFCTGFFIARKTDVLVDVFEKIVLFIKENKVGDQKAFNTIVARNELKSWDAIKLKKITTEQINLKLDFLPIEEFSNRRFYGVKTSTGFTEFEVPKQPRVFHANWCAGLENKYRLLNYIKEKNESTY